MSVCLCRRSRIRLSVCRNTTGICASFLVSDLGSCQQWRGVYSVGRLRTCDSHSGGSVSADSARGLGPRKSLDLRIRPLTLFTRGELRSGWSADGAAGQRIIICRIVAEEFGYSRADDNSGYADVHPLGKSATEPQLYVIAAEVEAHKCIISVSRCWLWRNNRNTRWCLTQSYWLG